MIGIFGGSGFYSLFEEAEKRGVETPYGKPSSKITIGKVGNNDVAFIARHGEKHEYPPHKVPYKANIYAMKQLGVERIIAPAAVGSLKPEIKPGDFLVPDQFVSFTNRDDTYYNGKHTEALGASFGLTTHISSADPYCPELRELIINEAKKAGLAVHGSGTVVVINGPRFASRAESNFFRSNNWDIINMTVYPELILARELELCYANIAIITDYDTGLKSDSNIKPVSLEEVVRVFKENNEKIKELLFNIIPKIPKERSCPCKNALEGARF
jgi:5'-methylthioadenosine phosphorylase